MSGPRANVLAGLLSLGSLSMLGCGSPIPNRDPVGERFPEVQGRDLEERDRTLPREHQGAPVLYLVGTVQETQFDIDRWLIGLLQLETPIRFVEVPTIPGLFPDLFLRGTIDAGMREGIPSEDWGGVVTLYADDAERVVAFTGTTIPRNARVLLLDEGGRVRWFHDRGFSPGVLLELDAAVRAVKAAPEPAGEPAPEKSQ
tara:strand:+ start:107 stop:706 length:600 start_codon:yes stop_codon:yes gene_type:complete